ncbi:MAG: hypothetical protein ACPL1A_07860, partial [Candidatus Kapaibacteriota bacterium]
MALCGRFKNIFIVLKLRLIQIIQRKRNYFVQINFAEKNYLFTSASGNLLRQADWCYFVETIYFGNEQKSAQTARSSIGQGKSLELCSNA